MPYSSLGNVDSAIAGSAHTVSQTYMFHYNGHLPIGPSCSVAEVTSGGARIYTNSQDLYGTRGQVVSALALAGPNLPANQVRVTYSEGSSVYGFSPYDDCTCSAAVISYLAGAPVRLQFMRWDEHGWDNYAPAQMMDVRGGVDANGNITAPTSATLDPAQGEPTRVQASVPRRGRSGSTSSMRRTWARSTRSRTSG